MSHHFGQRLHLHRKAAGKTLQDVADACGSTKAYLSQVERFDATGRMGADRALACAHFLGITLDELMREASCTSSEDLAFFKQYMALSGEDKARFRKVCRIISGEPV